MMLMKIDYWQFNYLLKKLVINKFIYIENNNRYRMSDTGLIDNFLNCGICGNRRNEDEMIEINVFYY